MRQGIMILQLFHSLLRCRRGSVTIEYIAVLPMMLLLTIGIVEYNLIMYGSAVLEGALTAAAREGATGYASSGVSQQTYINTIVQNRTAGLFNANNITISSKSYAAFDDIGVPEPCINPPTPPCPGTPGVNFADINHNGTWDADQGAVGLGGPNDIVVYTVSYPWPIFTPPLRALLGNTFTITSSTVVKNEPYP
jgi:Flp pilus assembly protein TadG